MRYGSGEKYDDLKELKGDKAAFESSTVVKTRTIEASIIYIPTYFDSAPATPDSTVMLLQVDQVEYT